MKALLKIIFTLTLLWIAGAVFFLAVAFAKYPQTDKADAIIALTGDAKRVEAALTLLHDKKAGALLISGVYQDTSLKDMLDTTSFDNAKRQDLLNHCCITLDHAAMTTVGNAMESVKWLEENKVETFILVTSDYHIPRTKLLFDFVLPDNITVYYAPVQSGGTRLSSRTLKHLFTEYHKTAITYVQSLIALVKKELS